jgi:hypothetical protein
LVRSGVISQPVNEKRTKGRPNLTYEESINRDFNDWSITNTTTKTSYKETLIYAFY